MKAFYGSRFSPNMTRTPEGFLICHNVPIARTGTQQYLANEVGGNDNTLVTAYRLEEDVFAPTTISSFEGKPVTDNHPAEMVDPVNYSGISRGTCTNVRRGEGEENDLLVADLIIMDSVLISEIESGKREVSCGYTCNYVPYKDGFKQTNILGNHVAVVTNGRAGSKVAIKDRKPKSLNTGGKRMGKKHSVLERMFAAFMRDEDTTPEDVREASAALDDLNEGEAKEPTTDEDNKSDEVAKAVEDAMAPFMAQLQELQKKVNDSDPDDKKEDVLDEFEKELTETSDDDGEESVTVEPEDIKTGDDGEETEEVETEAADSAAALAVFKALRPTLDTLPNDQKIQAVASMRKALLGGAKKTSDKSVDPYAAFLKRKSALDSKPDTAAADFGEACRKRNPHYKG